MKCFLSPSDHCDTNANVIVFCVEEVEAAQYTNVANMAIRVEDKNGNLISSLDISAEPDDGDSSDECGDVADLGATIAGHFNSFLSGGFQFMGLMCDL